MPVNTPGLSNHVGRVFIYHESWWILEKNDGGKVFPCAHARVVVLRVLRVLRVLESKNTNEINILKGLWWKDMGSTVEEYGAYGGKIWGLR